MKLSLMTLSMFLNMYIKFQSDQDTEDLIEAYEEMMQIVKASGYQAVDVTSMEIALMTEEKVKDILGKNHLSVGSYIYMEQFALMDEEGMKQRIENGKKAVDTAISLGTDVLMLVPKSHAGIENQTPQQIRGQLIRHWSPIAEDAKNKGIYVVIENTPDLKLHLCKMEELKEVLDAVPDLEVVYDCGNVLLVGEDPVAYYEAFADKTAHIHLKDIRLVSAQEPFADTAENGDKMKTAPTGTGLIDLKRIIRCAKQHDYKGYLTIEFMIDDHGNYQDSLVRSREYVKDIIEH